MLTQEKTRTRRRAAPESWPEVALADAPAAWFQVHGDGEGAACRVPVTTEATPGKGRVDALHLDGLGLRLVVEKPLSRGTRLMLNMTLPAMGPLHVRAVVHGSRKEGRHGHAAVLRFEHLAEVDRQSLQRYLLHRGQGGEQPGAPDNRKFQRFVRSMSVDYQVRGAKGLEPGKGQMVTLDIGGGGIRFRVSHALEVGDVLYVRLPLGQEPFYSLGKVVWTEASRVPGRFLAGLQFVDLPSIEQHRLMHHLAMPTN